MRAILLSVLVLGLWTVQIQADTLTIACAKGYKKPMGALIKNFEAKKGIHIEPFYGNMRQVISQSRLSGKVSIIIGDVAFLKKSNLDLAEFFDIGRGKLVLAYPKSRKLAAISDILDPSFKRIAMPNPKKAIYGKAAAAYLKSTGMTKKVENRVLTVATVPQVSAYLITGEIDAGFINLTDALGIKEKIGGYIEADTSFYPPIIIVGAVLKDAPDTALAKVFTDFINSPESRELLKGYGL